MAVCHDVMVLCAYMAVSRIHIYILFMIERDDCAGYHASVAKPAFKAECPLST